MRSIGQKIESFGTGKYYKDPEEGGPPLTFTPMEDPFPTIEVFTKGESEVPPKFRKLAKVLFGETEEMMGRLMRELQVAVADEGLVLPEYDLLHRMLLRAGGNNVKNTIKVYKAFISLVNGSPAYFEDVLPFEKSDIVFQERLICTPKLRSVRHVHESVDVHTEPRLSTFSETNTGDASSFFTLAIGIRTKSASLRKGDFCNERKKFNM